jgi:hypothetical protein
MLRTDIINFLIEKNRYKSYLEIGLNDGVNYRSINCKFKCGVDPDTSKYSDDTTFSMTSDVFFEKRCDRKFDLIFIDGLHLEAQVDKDVENSLKFLSDSGTIVLHDCNPPTIYHARENLYDLSTPARGKWNGTVWRSIVKLRTLRNDLDICVIDTDWGCGILKKSSVDKRFLKIPTEKCLEWEVFDSSRKEILNLISTQEFIKNS